MSVGFCVPTNVKKIGTKRSLSTFRGVAVLIFKALTGKWNLSEYPIKFF